MRQILLTDTTLQTSPALPHTFFLIVRAYSVLMCHSTQTFTATYPVLHGLTSNDHKMDMGRDSTGPKHQDRVFEVDEPLGLIFETSIGPSFIFLAEWKLPQSNFAAALEKSQHSVARILVEWWDQETDESAFATAIIARVQTCM